MVEWQLRKLLMGLYSLHELQIGTLRASGHSSQT
jgi:hypothetical protein